ncbi:MAG: hypothetical protein D6689_22145 [Deltaproteobacteria bacterium]|nr:MAG: hypothetical protein D6689_22145 [Deltaproteobacteria bacterium]
MIRPLALAFAVATGCVVRVDPADTRFRCEREPVCPAGFECVGGVCEPSGAAPDAGGPDGAADAGAVDGGAADAARAPCDATYGAAPAYVLCQQTATTCAFNAQTAGGTCGDACAAYGGACLGAFDNENGPGQECAPIAADDCTTPRETEICVCTRP